jgi:hypothetical protein
MGDKIVSGYTENGVGYQGAAGDTSHTAAVLLDSKPQKILNLKSLRDDGPDIGAALQRKTGVRYGTNFARSAELVNEGLARYTGEKRVNEETGRKGKVLEITENGLKYLQEEGE